MLLNYRDRGNGCFQHCIWPLDQSIGRAKIQYSDPGEFSSSWGHRHCSKYCIIVQFHHAFSILHHCMHPCHAPLPGSIARQPCPAVLPGSLARQPCPAALPGSLARQPCPTALPGSIARQYCPAVLPGSLAEKFVSCFTAVGRHACSIAYFYSAGSLVQAFPAIKDIAILSLVYKLILPCERV
jgi:hypothetical protein